MAILCPHCAGELSASRSLIRCQFKGSSCPHCAYSFTSTSDVPLYIAIMQEWVESEAGSGLHADGCSLHLTESDRELFVKRWLKTRRGTPDVHWEPGGDPYPIRIDPVTHQRLVNSTRGLRLFEEELNQLKAKHGLDKLDAVTFKYWKRQWNQKADPSE